jgi:hypothetical protein
MLLFGISDGELWLSRECLTMFDRGALEHADQP